MPYSQIKPLILKNAMNITISVSVIPFLLLYSSLTYNDYDTLVTKWKHHLNSVIIILLLMTFEIILLFKYYLWLYIEYVKKTCPIRKGHMGIPLTLPKKFNNIIHENQNVRYCNLKCTFFVPICPKSSKFLKCGNTVIGGGMLYLEALKVAWCWYFDEKLNISYFSARGVP